MVSVVSKNRNKSSLHKRKMKGGGKYEGNVLFIGAGGGGDTAAAILRAMAALEAGEINGEAYVIGAGYAREDYYKTLFDYGKNRNKKVKDTPAMIERLPVNYDVRDTDHADFANDKFRNTFEKPNICERFTNHNECKQQITTKAQNLVNEYLDNTIELFQTSLYKLKSTIDEDKHTFLEDMFPIQKSANARNDNARNANDDDVIEEENSLKSLLRRRDLKKTNSSFKYMTLLEERFMMMTAKQIADTMNKKEKVNNFIKNNVFMIESAGGMSKNTYDIISRQYNTLKKFIEENKISTVVVMDFGGDVFDYSNLARDSIMLMELLHIQQNESVTQKFTVDIEVYGPGCDAHATYHETITNMSVVKDRQENLHSYLHPDYTDIGNMPSFIGLLSTNRGQLEEINLLGPGRATGNFLMAHNSKNTTPTNINRYVTEWLTKRPDFIEKLDSDPLKKSIIDQGLASSKLTISNFAEVYRFKSTKDDSLVSKLRSKKENFNTGYKTLNNLVIYPTEEYLNNAISEFKEQKDLYDNAIKYETCTDIEHSEFNTETYNDITKGLKAVNVQFVQCSGKYNPFSLTADNTFITVENHPYKKCASKFNPQLHESGAIDEIDGDNNELYSNTSYPKYYKNYDDFVLIININSPYKELYDTDETEAGMGFVHLLALPKQRIYNIVTTNKDNFTERIKLWKKMRDTVNDLFKNEDERTKVCRVVQQLIQKAGKDRYNIVKTQFQNHAIDFIDNGGSFEYFFHAHPDHSIGYLHMHCVLSGDKEEFRTSRLHDHKSIPLDVVLKYTPPESQLGGGGAGKRRGVAKKTGLDKLTVCELREKAVKKNVLNVRKYKKDELIAILRNKVKVPKKATKSSK